MTGAEEADLLADGEHDVDRRMAEAALAADADALADDRDAGLVVAAEHGRAVAADDVAVDDRRDADRRARPCPCARRGATGAPGAVPGTCAIRLPTSPPTADAGVVELDLGAEAAQLRREPLGDAPLAAREAVDLDQLEEQRAQTIGLDHGGPRIRGPSSKRQRGQR